MATEPKAGTMVSLNDVVELASLFSRGRLGTITDPGGILADCTGRCGCVGGNCECRGGVYSTFDRSWVEIVSERKTRIAELKQQIEALEQER